MNTSLVSIKQNDKGYITKFDSSLVRNELYPDLKKILGRNKWLSPRNKYLKNCIGQIGKDTKKSVFNGQVTDIAIYILASSFNHCMDGWTFLGRALDAQYRFDRATSIHLAYYAELRAAMSILACSGIGVFNNKHLIVYYDNSKLNVHTISQIQMNKTVTATTHKACWALLDEWTRTEQCKQLLMGELAHDSITLGDWLSNLISARAIGQRWLKQWGVDLKRFAEMEDSTARNEVSYRPSRLQPTNHVSIQKNVDFISNFWQLCEPSGNTNYCLQAIDLQLLYSSLLILKKRKPSGYNAAVEKMILSVYNINKDEILTNKKAALWQKQFVGLEESHLNSIVSYAKRKDSHTHADFPYQILSRAFLLLRMATAGCQKIIKEANINSNMLSFWWQPLAENSGLIDQSSYELGDTWQDVTEALSNIETSSTYNSTMQWRRENSNALAILGECERVGLWGMGL